MQFIPRVEGCIPGKCLLLLAGRQNHQGTSWHLWAHKNSGDIHILRNPQGNHGYLEYTDSHRVARCVRWKIHLHVISMAIINKSNYSEINTAAAHKMDMFSKIWRVLVYVSSLALDMLVYNNRRSCWVTLTSYVNYQSFILDLTLFMFNKYFEKRTDEFNFPCRKTGLIMSPFINVRNSKKKRKKKNWVLWKKW